MKQQELNSIRRQLKTIREQDPLKQGLKLANLNVVNSITDYIREQDPLKQGLKQHKYLVYKQGDDNS